MAETQTEVIPPTFAICTNVTRPARRQRCKERRTQWLTLTSVDDLLVARLVDYSWEHLTVETGATPAGNVSVKGTIQVLGALIELSGTAFVEHSRSQTNGLFRLALRFNDASCWGSALCDSKVA
jgi:hypothetical protein